MIDPELLACPVSGTSLRLIDGFLVSDSGQHYRITASGIPLFAEHYCSEDARRQQAHYDDVAVAYLENLAYPHTQEYMDYLDHAFLEAVGEASLDSVAELCCGNGEAFRLLESRMRRGVGLDVSVAMLEAAVRVNTSPGITFVQGDATRLPLATGAFDSVFMLGGIHHINERLTLFREIARILKPGGRFYWREPVSDFWPWRILRAIIYRLSPALDHATERPLRYSETIAPLKAVGLRQVMWRTYGFLGFCLFMNSDVLIFNRILRFVPGIRTITRLAAAADDKITRLPIMRGSGLQVIGIAEKPLENSP